MANHTSTAAGSYTAIVTATNSVGSLSASTPVTINQAMTPTFILYLPVIAHRSSSPLAVAAVEYSRMADKTAAMLSERTQAWLSRKVRLYFD